MPVQQAFGQKPNVFLPNCPRPQTRSRWGPISDLHCQHMFPRVLLQTIIYTSTNHYHRSLNVKMQTGRALVPPINTQINSYKIQFKLRKQLLWWASANDYSSDVHGWHKVLWEAKIRIKKSRQQVNSAMVGRNVRDVVWQWMCTLRKLISYVRHELCLHQILPCLSRTWQHLLCHREGLWLGRKMSTAGHMRSPSPHWPFQRCRPSSEYQS